MSLHLGDIAPDFTAETQSGELSFHSWKGDSWAILFSHPADFTPVCTTEMGRFAQLAPEFEKRNVKLIGLSVDSADEHRRWIPDIEKFKGDGVQVEYPIIADEDRKVAQAYDMIHPGEGDASSVRSVFLIDPDHKIRIMLVYPKSVGRNFDEMLRMVDAIQATDEHGTAAPADWRPGDRMIVPPSIETTEARERFEDVDEIYPYLRFTTGRK